MTTTPMGFLGLGVAASEPVYSDLERSALVGARRLP
ncbi:MAG: hypothetical protein JWP07_4901, partial [Pseudonocardiales bacterium]|nr:hypothetical protein [Pseudonocardiales bacterium]